MVQEAINLFADVVAAAIPYAVVFALASVWLLCSWGWPLKVMWKYDDEVETCYIMYFGSFCFWV